MSEPSSHNPTSEKCSTLRIKQESGSEDMATDSPASVDTEPTGRVRGSLNPPTSASEADERRHLRRGPGRPRKDTELKKLPELKKTYSLVQYICYLFSAANCQRKLTRLFNVYDNVDVRTNCCIYYWYSI